MKNWKTFLMAASIRATRTMAQTALSLLSCAVFMGDVDWILVGSASLLAGVISVLTSIVTGLPEVPIEESTEEGV